MTLRARSSRIAWCFWLLTCAAAAARADAPFRFGAFEHAVTNLALPSAAVVSDAGEIFIAETGAHRIAVFDRAGRLLRTFGQLGDGPGMLHSPAALAIDSRGRLLVADTGNARITAWSHTGDFLDAWGSRGSGPGAICEVLGIATHGERIAIADAGNQRITVFDLDGAVTAEIGGERADGQPRFRRPVAVAFDTRGRLAVVDADRANVHLFNSDGQPLRTFGDFGPFIGLLNEPMGALFAGDELLVVDTANHRVQHFNERGETTRQWGVHDPATHEGNGRIHYPHALAIGGSGDDRFAVLCEPLEHRVQVFAALRSGETQQPRQGDLAGEMTHFGLRIAIDGRLMLIPEPEHQFIYVLDTLNEAPAIISQFGQCGAKPGQFMRPAGVSVDQAQRVALVLDHSLSRMQRFTLNFLPDQPLKFDPFFGKFVRAVDFTHPRFASPTQGLPWTFRPETLRRDAQGRLHMLDRRNAVVIVLDDDMRFVRAYGNGAAPESRLRRPTDLAISPDGSRVAVVDADNFRVLVFDDAGQVVMRIGGHGADDGRFLRPFGVVIDQHGSIYVSDELLDCVQKFDAAGQFIARWGTRGADHGEFWRPAGLAIDNRDRLIVIDHGNHRAQMFSLDGQWLGTFGAGRAYLRRELED